MQPPPEDDPAEVAEVHAEAEKALREGDTRKTGVIFADVLDDLHSIDANPSHIPADEQERVLREDAQFRQALLRALGDHLRGQGIRVEGVLRDGEGEGWCVYTRDSAGRPFTVTYTYDEAIDSAVTSGREFMGRQIIDEIVGKVVTARERYFARMQ